MKLHRIESFLACLIILSLLFVGCAGIQIAREDIPRASYVSARATFNTHLETYLNYRDMLPEGTKKEALRNKYEQDFWKAKEALDIWGAVVDMGTDPTSAITNYNKLIDFIVMELIKDEIIQIGVEEDDT